MIDVVKMLHDGKLNVQEAEDLLDEVLDRFHRGGEQLVWAEEIGLSNYEATAYAQSASLADIAVLRYEGWPSSCSRCGKALDYRKYGWWFERGERGIPTLHHIVCPQ